jgi:hypothetical protein
MKIALGDLCELGGGSWGKLGRTLADLGGTRGWLGKFFELVEYLSVFVGTL